MATKWPLSWLQLTSGCASLCVTPYSRVVLPNSPGPRLWPGSQSPARELLGVLLRVRGRAVPPGVPPVRVWSCGCAALSSVSVWEDARVISSEWLSVAVWGGRAHVCVSFWKHNGCHSLIMVSVSVTSVPVAVSQCSYVRRCLSSYCGVWLHAWS